MRGRRSRLRSLTTRGDPPIRRRRVASSEQFDYSNLGYGVLGEAIAHTARESLDAALRHLVFEPLQMAACSLGFAASVDAPNAVRYEVSSPPRQPAAPKVTTTPAASAVYCNVEDLARFGMFHLKDHLPSQQPIITDVMIDEMHAPTPEPKATQQYGMGWWVQSELHGFHGVLAHGGTGNATARLQLIPSEDLAVAMVSNSAIDSPKIVDAALAAMLPAYKADLERLPAPPGPAQTPTAAPAPPRVDVAGTWSRFVETYKGRVPLTLRVDPSGAIVATLGSAPEVTPNARFGPNVIRWTMSGHLGVEGEPFDLATRLCPRDRVLAAAAQTVPAANHPVAFLTYYSVRAHDDD
jgi:CubicO group peptidase (beta-lactamase class C family)